MADLLMRLLDQAHIRLRAGPTDLGGTTRWIECEPLAREPGMGWER